VKAVELVVVAVCVLGGLRSAWIWLRRPFHGRDIVDHMLYAMYLTGRIGLWFAFAGMFAIYFSVNTRGRAFTDDANGYRWYLLLLVGLSAMQFVGGQLLGRRAPDEPEGDGGSMTEM
jgi:hypothetical protein